METSENDLFEEDMYDTHSLSLHALNSHQRKLLYQTLSNSYPFLSMEEDASDNKVSAYVLF